MLRPSSATRLLAFHPLPQPSALRTFNVLSALRRCSPPAPYRTRRSVATIVTETSGAQPSILTHAPTLEDIKDSEYDADLVPPEEAELEITQRAAKVSSQLSSIPDPLFAVSKIASVPTLNTRTDGSPASLLQQLHAISQREGDPGAALRITIESGGCHGYQYKMELSKHSQPDD